MAGLHIFPVNWTIESYFATNELRPANIQRDFQWTKHEVSQLLQDLFDFMESGEPVYYLGTMIGAKDEDGAISIYDGLQRTTTLTIILSVIRDNIDNALMKERINRCIFNDNRQTRLVLSGPNNSLFTCAQKIGSTTTPIVGGAYTGAHFTIRRNVNLVIKRIQALDDAMRLALAKTILEKTEIVFVLANNQRVCERIFDSTNRRGLSIDPYDLIKMRLTEMAKDRRDAEFLTSKWDMIRSKIKSRFPAFLDALSVVTTRKPLSRSTPETLVQWMRSRHARDDSGLHAWLNHTASFHTEAWNIVNDAYTSGVTRKSLSQIGPIWPLDFIEWMPLALTLYSNAQQKGKNKAERLKLADEDFDLLQRRAMALYLSAVPTGNREQYYIRAINQAAIGQNPFIGNGALSISQPLRNRIRANLSKPITEYMRRRIILKWLCLLVPELTSRRMREDDAEVEHVLPANPQAGNIWLDLFPDIDQRSRLTDLLGNLILVPKRVNAALEQNGPDRKLEILKQADCAPLYRHFFNVSEEQDWSSDTIERRTRQMGELIWKELKLPDDPPYPASSPIVTALDEDGDEDDAMRV